MEQQIYNSSNEDALLKSMGPFRVNLTDSSLSGVIGPEVINIGIQTVIGEITIYGENP